MSAPNTAPAPLVSVQPVVRPAPGRGEDPSGPRAEADVLPALTGPGDERTPFAAENSPFGKPAFATVAAPALIVAGGNDRQAAAAAPETDPNPPGTLQSK